MQQYWCAVSSGYLCHSKSEICSEGKASLPDFLKLTGKAVVSPAKSVLGSFSVFFFHMFIKYLNAWYKSIIMCIFKKKNEIVYLKGGKERNLFNFLGTLSSETFIFPMVQ